MADSSVAVTPGSGAGVDAWQLGAGTGDFQQYVRLPVATTITHTAWTVSTTAAVAATAVAACVQTVMVLQGATGRVYLRFDGTNPTTTVYHWYLDPDDRYEVPSALAASNVRAVGATAAGTLIIAQCATAG